MKLDLDELAKFLVKAKTSTYAVSGKEVLAQRPGFKELEFREGNLSYRDSYAGFFMAPGQEVVRFNNQPIWAMAYSGGMLPEYREGQEFAEKTFSFLKKALMQVRQTRSFRGPQNLKEGKWEYKNSSKGSVADFNGTEQIYFERKEVFKQNYIGGLIIPKSSGKIKS